MIESLMLLAGRRNLHRSLHAHSRESSASAHALAAAIDSAQHQTFSGAENAWLGRIEKLRNNLASSQEVLSVEDFGAGKSGNLSVNRSPGSSLVRVVGEICRSSSISRRWGALLFQIVRHLRPAVCVELGTSLGLSASYLGAACALNGSGTVVTLEGASSLASLARRNHASLGLDMITVVTGRFDETLHVTLSANPPIDFAFIDGHHDRNATLRYFGQIKPHLSNRAVVVFDDILWSRGMRQAWKDIRRTAEPAVTADLVKMGVFCNDKAG